LPFQKNFVLKNFLFWQIALISLLADRLSKLWVITNFQLTIPPQTMPLWPGVFHFTYVANSGAAFSSFPGGSIWLRWFSLAVSIAIIWMVVRRPRLGNWEQVALGFLFGGAAGNGIDRFIKGKVVDFLDVRLINFPVFNLADIFINIGIVCLLIILWQNRSTPTNPKP
jgi:signal peptidase II